MNDSYNACFSRVVIQLLTARGILNFGIVWPTTEKPDGSRKESRGPHKLSAHHEFVENIHLLWTCSLDYSLVSRKLEECRTLE